MNTIRSIFILQNVKKMIILSLWSLILYSQDWLTEYFFYGYGFIYEGNDFSSEDVERYLKLVKLSFAFNPENLDDPYVYLTLKSENKIIVVKLDVESFISKIGNPLKDAAQILNDYFGYRFPKKITQVISEDSFKTYLKTDQFTIPQKNHFRVIFIGEEKNLLVFFEFHQKSGALEWVNGIWYTNSLSKMLQISEAIDTITAYIRKTENYKKKK